MSEILILPSPKLIAQVCIFSFSELIAQSELWLEFVFSLSHSQNIEELESHLVFSIKSKLDKVDGTIVLLALATGRIEIL